VGQVERSRFKTRFMSACCLLSRRTVQRVERTCQGKAAFRNARRNVIRGIPASSAISFAVTSFAAATISLSYLAEMFTLHPSSIKLLLAFLMKLLKRPPLILWAAVLGSMMANAITAALLPYVSFLFFGEAISGATASLLWLGAIQPLPAWDTSYFEKTFWATLIAPDMSRKSTTPSGKE
jgi:hypothetical protein